MRNNIINKIYRGDRNAFRKIFDEYFNALAAFGYKYVQEVAIAEDLVQEAFIHFWENRTNFDHVLAIKSFLYTSVRNKALNYLKHEKVKQKHKPMLEYVMHTDQYFAEHVIEEEVFNKLYNVIHQLPKSARKIMLLALNGLKNSEIAEELGVSVNTVKTQKKIGYSKIKDQLEPMLQTVLLMLISV